MSVTHNRTTTAGVSLSSRREKIKTFLMRVAVLATGTSGVFYINQNFDYGAYPYVAVVADSWVHTYLGTFIVTFGIMTLASIVLSLSIIWIHDWTGQDWLGLEGLKEFKEDTLTLRFPPIPSPLSWRTLAYVVFFPLVVLMYLVKWIWVHLTRWKYGTAVVYVGFSFYDPVYATIYMRDQKNESAWFTRRDWAIFFGSIAIANVIWSLFVSWVAPWAWAHVSTLLYGPASTICIQC